MSKSKASMAPAVVDIQSATCVSGEADAVVSGVVTVLISTEETLETGEPAVKVGTVDATVTEQSGSPSSPTPSSRLHTFEYSATVDCDANYQVTAEASIIIKETATPASVTCDPCSDPEECGSN